MGNAPSRNGLATIAMAKYMHVSKDNLLDMREACEEMGTDDMLICRQVLQVAMNRTGLQPQDYEIFDLLYTMWDLKGDDLVPYREFLCGASVLACPCENLFQIMCFAMEMMDMDDTDQINAKQLLAMLKSINVTMTYFGDAALTLLQIHKLTDSIFETITVLSHDSTDYLSHDECVKRLMLEPLVQRAAFNRLVIPAALSSAPAAQHQRKQLQTGRVGELYSRRQHHPHNLQVLNVSDSYSGTDDEDSRMSMTDVSSVVLTPLVNLAIDVRTFGTHTLTEGSHTESDTIEEIEVHNTSA